MQFTGNVLTLLLTRIGQVEQGSGVRVLDAAGAEMPVTNTGWKHMR